METWNRPRRAALKSLEQRAVRTCAPRGVRHSKDLPPEHAALADRALQRIVDVMEEEVHSKRAKAVLTAAVEIRDELLGPKTKKIEIEGSLEQILVATLEQEPSTPSLDASTPVVTVESGAISPPNELADPDRTPELEAPTGR